MALPAAMLAVCLIQTAALKQTRSSNTYTQWVQQG
jgi:archaellin